MTEKNIATEAEVKEVAFVLRELTADDIFPMFNIISKIGIKEFKATFESDDVKTAIAQMAKDGGENAAADFTTKLGIGIALDVAGIVISNIGKCKEDIYMLLAQLSGMSKGDIAKLPMTTFFEMIVAVIKKEEFKDFFQVVAKLFK